MTLRSEAKPYIGRLDGDYIEESGLELYLQVTEEKQSWEEINEGLYSKSDHSGGLRDERDE